MSWINKVFFLLLLSSSLEAATFRVAVVVGNNQGSPERISLRYAEPDAKGVYETLTQIGGFKEEHSFLLLGKNVETLRKTLERAQSLVRNLIHEPFDDVLFFFYYSGHAEGGFLELGGGKISIEEIKEFFRTSRAKLKLAVLDSCYSGELTRAKGGVVVPSFPIQLQSFELPSGEVFITSSTDLESSHESARLQGSFFTHFFLSGLRGDADFNRDGRVSLTEVYPYAAQRTIERTSRLWGREQHPTYEFRLSGGGEIVLSELARDVPLLVLSSSEEGNFSVYHGATRKMVLEVEKRAGEEKRIALPEGIFLIQHAQGAILYEKELRVQSHGVYLVDWRQARKRPYHPGQRFLESYVSSKEKQLLREGELIRVHLMETINSKLSHAGDKVSLEVSEDVWVGETLVVQAGAPATGEILQVKPKRGLSSGVVVCRLGYVQAADGQWIPLNSLVSRVAHGRALDDPEQALQEEGRPTTTMDIASGLTATLLFPIYPFVQGRHAIIEKGTPFEAYVARDMWVAGYKATSNAHEGLYKKVKLGTDVP